MLLTSSAVGGWGLILRMFQRMKFEYLAQQMLILRVLLHVGSRLFLPTTMPEHPLYVKGEAACMCEMLGTYPKQIQLIHGEAIYHKR